MGAEADPILPTPRLNIAGIARPVEARLLSVAACAPAVDPARFYHVEIDVGGTALEGAFMPGQSFGVVPPLESGEGKASLRIYSIASASSGEDGRGRVISAMVRVAKGATGAAGYVASREPGDVLRLTGPLGRNFLLPVGVGEHEYVFVGSGTGVGPFRGMLLELAERAPGALAVLITAAASEGELPYHGLFMERAGRQAGFVYVPSVGNGIEEGVRRAAGLLKDPRTLLYVCGPDELDKRVFGALEREGLGAGYVGAQGRPTRRCMIVSY